MCLIQVISFACGHMDKQSLHWCHNTKPAPTSRKKFCGSTVQVRTHIPNDFCESCTLDESKEQAEKSKTFARYLKISETKPTVTRELRDMMKFISDALATYHARSLKVDEPYDSAEFTYVDGYLGRLNRDTTEVMELFHHILHKNYWHILETGTDLLGLPAETTTAERKLLISLRTLLLDNHKYWSFDLHFLSSRAEYLESTFLVPRSKEEIVQAGLDRCSITGDLYFEQSMDETVDNTPMALSCPSKHVFSKWAILKWLEFNHSCPLCRAEILPVFRNRCEFRRYLSIQWQIIHRDERVPDDLQFLVITNGNILIELDMTYTLMDVMPRLRWLDPDSFRQGKIDFSPEEDDDVHNDYYEKEEEEIADEGEVEEEETVEDGNYEGDEIESEDDRDNNEDDSDYEDEDSSETNEEDSKELEATSILMKDIFGLNNIPASLIHDFHAWRVELSNQDFRYLIDRIQTLGGNLGGITVHDVDVALNAHLGGVQRCQDCYDDFV